MQHKELLHRNQSSHNSIIHLICRQLRDYRKANNLYYSCGEKFEPGYQAVCPKKQQPQVNTLAINDLDKEEITKEMLNQLAAEDLLTADFCKLSLNALTTVDSSISIKLRSLVKNKVMLILLDSGSSHSFVSKHHFTDIAQLPTIQIPARRVKLANGEWLTTSTMVQNLQWYIQGATLTSDMLVLDMAPYDAILGYDWLKKHSPMNCDWNQKTLEFTLNGKQVRIQGVSAISATQLYKGTKGKDTWAFVIVDSLPPPKLDQGTPTPPCIQQILDEHKLIFQDPKTLPPSRCYDHAIPLIPGAMTVNARLYNYSPQHKTETE